MSVINGIEVVLTKEGEGDWVASLTNVLGDEIVGYGETEHQAIEDLRTALYHRGEYGMSEKTMNEKIATGVDEFSRSRCSSGREANRH